MEALLQQVQRHSDFDLMNSISGKFRTTLVSSSIKLSTRCAPNLTVTQDLISRRKSSIKFSKEVSDAKLKEKWLDSLACPFPEKLLRIPNPEITDLCLGTSDSNSPWVIGIDPDVSGALALLKTSGDDSGCSPQVFDSPHLKVLIGGRVRRRLDAKSIVQLLKSFDAPVGTTAYIEQSIPYPKDGKQGWWSGGFGYGLWIGILVSSGFSVIPVPSLVWKNEFKLSGNRSSKDDSREVASSLFPSVSSQLTRKKDHGRAEALLIAAYGKGLKRAPTDKDSQKN